MAEDLPVQKNKKGKVRGRSAVANAESNEGLQQDDILSIFEQVRGIVRRKVQIKGALFCRKRDRLLKIIESLHSKKLDVRSLVQA